MERGLEGWGLEVLGCTFGFEVCAWDGDGVGELGNGGSGR